MSQQYGHLQNLTEGSQESLRALIQAIIPDTGTTPDGGLKGDTVARLTEKLTELMGHETTEPLKQKRNERGELVNEEGLPIVDITESVYLNTGSVTPPPVTVEPLLPLASLPLPVRERLRERRNRILDLLEEEERQSELLEKEPWLEERADILRKRNEEVTREKNGLRDARELQKKMGRALLQNIRQARKKEDEEQEVLRRQDEQMWRRRSPTHKKKTVTFAETPNVQLDKPSVVWGDIAPARIQNIKRPTLASQSLLDVHPMKMSVVERIPGRQIALLQTSRLALSRPDSDDESDLEHISDLPDDATDEDEPILEEDEVDFDFAQHQREIAIEYYKKRNVIGQEAASAMLRDTHETDNANIENSQNGNKSILSQFRASKLVAAYGASAQGAGSDSVSLGASILPASSTRTLQKAIKIGKLDSDGQLVGLEDNSASEDEEPGMQEVLELLQKGEIYNLGPNGEHLQAIRHAPSSTIAQSDCTQSTLPPPRRSGNSKFKASLSASGRPTKSRQRSIDASPASQMDEVLSPSMTPVSHQDRSSPTKSSTPPSLNSITAEELKCMYLPDPSKTQAFHSSPFSMIINSPSFPMPEAPSVMVLSPSFPPTSRRPDRPPTVLSAKVYESKRPTASASVHSSEKPDLDVVPHKKVSRFKAERM